MEEAPAADPTVSLPDDPWKRLFRRRVLGWFRRNARELPWRKTKDPYQIWVSEIMLQQTQVATVVPYFQRFVERFPTISHLARADVQQVLQLWEGLGYYRRARQMHQAAQLMVERFDGQFPSDFEDVIALPGIGRYTAGAILSISGNQRHPILEGNTNRLFSRLLLLRRDPTLSHNQKLLWEFSRQLLPSSSVGDFNQALMELGSEVCFPKQPDCHRCPVNGLCPTYVHGMQAEIPAPKRRPTTENVYEAAVVVRRQGRILMRQCQANQRWAGLWDFPRFRVQESDCRRELVQQMTEATGLKVQLGTQLTTIKHTVTRFRITLMCYQSRSVSGRLQSTDFKWVAPKDLADFPLSVTGRKIADQLTTDVTKSAARSRK